MQQNRCSKANRTSASQNLPAMYWNPKVSYRVQKSPNFPNPKSAAIYLILSSYRNCKRPLLLKFSYQYLISIYSFIRVISQTNMHRPETCLWFATLSWCLPNFKTDPPTNESELSWRNIYTLDLKLHLCSQHVTSPILTEYNKLKTKKTYENKYLQTSLV